MIFYQVFCTVPSELAEDWQQWMSTSHIPAVLTTGLFIDAAFTEEIDARTNDTQLFCTLYRLERQELYDIYRERHAPTLQAHVRERYGERIRCTRHLLHVLSEFGAQQR